MDLTIEGKTYVDGRFEDCCIGITNAAPALYFFRGGTGEVSQHLKVSGHAVAPARRCSVARTHDPIGIPHLAGKAASRPTE